MEDINLEDIKDILKTKANLYSDDDLFDNAVKIEYLVEQWLDTFEKEIFEGKSLIELLSSVIA